MSIYNRFCKYSTLVKLAKEYFVPFLLRITGGKIRTKNYIVYVDSHDNKGVLNFVHNLFHRNVDFESYEIEVFSHIVTKYTETIVFDIGANYGMYTLSACALRKNEESISIVAVEADSRVFTCLKKSVIHNKYEKICRPVHAAAGSRHNDRCVLVRHNKQSSFNFTSPSSSTICPEDYQMSDFVRVVTVDGLIKELGLTTEKMIVKIDIEGNEFHAINGMEDALKTCSGYVIFCEYSVNRMNIAGNNRYELLEKIFSLGVNGVYEINPETRAIIQCTGVEDFLREDRNFCNLMIVKNMDISFLFS